MTPLLSVFIFGFGAIVGSFLNAVLWRLRTGESFIYGRSYCPDCRHQLSAKDLLPLLSYLLLRGKCRYCDRTINPSYFYVEAAAGTLFLLFAYRAIPPGVYAVSAAELARMLLSWYFAAVLILVFVYDLRYMLILRSVTLPATFIAGLANVALGMTVGDLLLGCIIGAGVFYAQYALSKGRWIGGGDVYLGLLMGAMLGAKLTLVALFIAYVAGALFGVALLATGKKGWQSQIPFGTFLSAATVFSLLFGRNVLDWYLGFL